MALEEDWTITWKSHDGWMEPPGPGAVCLCISLSRGVGCGKVVNSKEGVLSSCPTYVVCLEYLVGICCVIWMLDKLGHCSDPAGCFLYLY